MKLQIYNGGREDLELRPKFMSLYPDNFIDCFKQLTQNGVQVGLADISSYPYNGLLSVPNKPTAMEFVHRSYYSKIAHLKTVQTRTVSICISEFKSYEGYFSEQYFSSLKSKQRSDYKGTMKNFSQENVHIVLGVSASCHILGSKWYFEKWVGERSEDEPTNAYYDLTAKVMGNLYSFALYDGSELIGIQYFDYALDGELMPTLVDVASCKNPAYKNAGRMLTYALINLGIHLKAAYVDLGFLGDTDLDYGFKLSYLPADQEPTSIYSFALVTKEQASTLDFTEPINILSAQYNEV